MGTIIIEDLVLRTSIGVTDREKKRKQKLLVSVEIERNVPAGAMGDAIQNTLDYSEVRRRIRSLATGAQYNLIETVAERVALALKEAYAGRGIGNVHVTVKKFPYRDAKHVAYRLTI